MHRQPDVLSIAPDMVGQTYGHRRGAQRAPLAQALVWHHEVVEADHQPEASRAPGQTAGAAPQGSDERPRSVPYQRSIKAVWIVEPSWRKRNCWPKRRGPPNPTRLRTSTTCPAGLRTLTTWA